jgi:hypothetical protein
MARAMKKLSVSMRAGLGALALMAVTAAPAAHAAIVFDQGTNFTVIEYCEGNPAGSVVLRLDTLAPGAINNSIAQVLPAAGWSYQIKKSGGVNQPVEVQFSNGTQTAKYRSLVEPGRNSVSCPVVK